MNKLIQALIKKIAAIGTQAGDSEDLKLKKSLIVLCTFPFMIAGLVWGMMYISFGEKLAGCIPITYSIISGLSVIYFGISHRFEVFRFSQLFLILILPFLLMVALKGFVSGSAVILWSLICPMGAMLFDKPANGIRWFIGFIVLVVLSGFLQPFIGHTNQLTVSQINLFFVINFVGVGMLIILMVYYFVQKKNIYQERSELLLLNILPKELVDILREEHRTVVNYYDHTSILFADLVNFTTISASLAPKELLELLNEVFSAFDKMVEKYGLEKIKTIGDCYMVASGVPRVRSDHAVALTNMALDMRDYILNNQFNGRKLQLRIGINSGAVVAGVIGHKKFSFDLWGDAVNTASRMESHGDADSIQISHATYELIKNDFKCVPKGLIQIKGKGPMNIWLVENKIPRSTIEP